MSYWLKELVWSGKLEPNQSVEARRWAMAARRHSKQVMYITSVRPLPRTLDNSFCLKRLHVTSCLNECIEGVTPLLKPSIYTAGLIARSANPIEWYKLTQESGLHLLTFDWKLSSLVCCYRLTHGMNWAPRWILLQVELFIVHRKFCQESAALMRPLFFAGFCFGDSASKLDCSFGLKRKQDLWVIKHFVRKVNNFLFKLTSMDVRRSPKLCARARRINLSPTPTGSRRSALAHTGNFAK